MVPFRLKQALAALTVPLFLMGCPLGGSPATKNAELTVLMAANDAGLRAKSTSVPKARVVQQEELVSLTITVDQVALQQVGDPANVVVIDTPFDLNLLDILNMPNLIDLAPVPPGEYEGAVLSLSGAAAVFADAPDAPVAVDLLDGGNLRVPISFSVVAGEAGLLVFDLGAITLVELDAGGYQLIPDLQVGLFNAVQAQVRGEIVESSPDDAFIVVRRGDAEILVDVLNAAIFLPDDFDTANGAPADLIVGAEVVAIGTLNFDGSLGADTVAILDFPVEDDESTRGGKFHIYFRLVSTGVDPDAEGEARFKTHDNFRQLKIKMEDLTLIRVVEVAVDGELIADARVRKSEKAHINLVSARGDYVPAMTENSVIEVFDAETGELVLVSEVGTRHERGHRDDDDDDDDDDK